MLVLCRRAWEAENQMRDPEAHRVRGGVSPGRWGKRYWGPQINSVEEGRPSGSLNTSSTRWAEPR